MSQKTLKADALMLLITLAWGLTFPLIRNAVTQVSPDVFVLVRFLIGGLILVPFLWRSILNTDKRTFIFGLTIAGINAVIYLTQTIGMETLTAAQGGFLTGLSVIFVPLLLPFFGLGKPGLKDLFCAGLCLIGIAVLTGAGFHHVPAGVYWVAVAAFFVGLSIVVLQVASQDAKNTSALAFFQIFLTWIFIVPFTLHAHYSNIFKATPLIAVLFCAIFATAFALFIQTKYQRLTNPSRAALIFALEPVFATILGYFLNGTPITWRVITGGGMILLSILVSEVL